ncbi:MAG TPA: thiamine phosphate synthase [Sphingomonas sp.]
MTDERMGEALWPALRHLPRGAGIVFRHYSLRPTERRALYERVRRVGRARRLMVLVAGPPALAIAWRADGAHGRSPHRRASRPLIRTMPCHDCAALVAGRRAGCALRFLSPIHATRSHPGGAGLGRVRAGLMIGRDRAGIVALGGMDRRRAASLRRLGILRWAAIDAWLQDA